jgi:hypothetical protein
MNAHFAEAYFVVLISPLKKISTAHPLLHEGTGKAGNVEPEESHFSGSCKSLLK